MLDDGDENGIDGAEIEAEGGRAGGRSRRSNGRDGVMGFHWHAFSD